MPLEITERAYLERQVTLARAVIAALSLVALLETAPMPERRVPVVFLSAYLFVALAAVFIERVSGKAIPRIPLFADFIVLCVFVYLTPSVSAFWFLFMFAVFALSTRGNTRAMLGVVAFATAGIIVRVALANPFRWQSVWHWVAIGFGTIVSGLGMGFLGAREREHLARQQLLDKITGHLRFDRGLTESIRQALGELALAFDCEQACLAIRDDEVERIFVWKVSPTERQPRPPETLPLTAAENFLIDSLDVSMAWEQRNGLGTGGAFGWDRRTGQPFRKLPVPSAKACEELGARSLLAATIESEEKPVGRVLLINRHARHNRHRRYGGHGRNGNGVQSGLQGGNLSAPANGLSGSGNGGANGHASVLEAAKANGHGNGDITVGAFSPSDLRWLEQIVRHLGPPLENIFLLRNLRTRAVESERSRISRDLHDGILQTLLSLKIRLGVLQNKPPESAEQTAAEMGNLQKIVNQESEELRRFVTEMRPLRVESADMKELMLGFAERFRNEQGLAVDLFVEARDLRLPDRVCRELFQIYRESLHNVKKHAKASHVVVKLEQDEAKVFLVVDDNGRGFSFSGRYTNEELDRLRLGPISIKERTRSVGGTLTVESNPGHGARLTIEIPFN
jgi:signal transduction histidine kinase